MWNASLYTYLFLNGEGKFEVHVTVRSTGKEKGTAKEVVQAVSEQREDVLSLHREVRR